MLDLARRTLTAEPNNARYLETLGAVCYRAGDYPAALKHLKQASAIQQSTPWTQLFLAMTHHQSKEPDEARRWLALAEQKIERDTQPPEPGSTRTSPTWDERVVWQHLLAEARELLAGNSDKFEPLEAPPPATQTGPK